MPCSPNFDFACVVLSRTVVVAARAHAPIADCPLPLAERVLPSAVSAPAGERVRINLWQVRERLDCCELHLFATSTAVLKRDFHESAFNCSGVESYSINEVVR